MWLDRLSGHATPSVSPPQSSSRAYSPAPRRSSSLAVPYSSKRPGFNPRISSQSLVSNDSTTSLLSGSRKVNGSGLKQVSRPDDYRDPLDVLEDILGPEIKEQIPYRETGKTEGIDGTDTDVFLSVGNWGDVDFEGLTLRQLACRTTVDEDHLEKYRPQTAEEHERDKSKFEDLHRSIRACDDVLTSVETNLTNFQNDLGVVSAEIETLQARSTALSIRLENRKVVEKGLGPIVEEITVSPAVVRKISEGVIDEQWVKALAEVEKRSKALELKSEEHRNVKSVTDLRPLLDNLVNKALERIRDFLVSQIKALRSPNINAQIIQQQHFLRYKDLFIFLWRHHEKLAEEICQAYLNTMRWYFLNHFNRYEKALERLKVHVIDRRDALGADDGSRKGTLLSNSKPSGPPHDAFNIGRRMDLLKASQNALPSYLAEEDKATHYLEYPFRSFNLALIDNCTAEYAFLTTFFAPSFSLQVIFKHFEYIFAPTFALGQGLTKTLVSETLDCLGLLLCVRLNQHLAFELQRRKCPAADTYINGTRMLLWPRFQVVMDIHCTSLRSLTSSLPSLPPSKSEQAKQSAAPHFLTQRFGQFLHGILALSTEAGDDEPVASSLGRLRGEMEAFLTKVGKAIGEKRKRERFLYNNYSLVLTIVGDVDGNLAAEQKAHFEALVGVYASGT